MEKKNHQLSPEPVIHALSQSFSHASHGVSQSYSFHVAPSVPVMGVPNRQPLKTHDPEAGTCMVDGIRPASLR